MHKVRLKAPYKGGSVSLGGMEHQIGDDGFVDVDDQYVKTLIETHGFIDPHLPHIYVIGEGDKKAIAIEIAMLVEILGNLGVDVKEDTPDMMLLTLLKKASEEVKANASDSDDKPERTKKRA